MSLPRPVRRFLLKYLTVVTTFGAAGLLRLICRKIFRPRPKRFSRVSDSLRRINKDLPLPAREDDRNTEILRLGR